MTKIDEKLFRDEHYLGRPADLADKIVSRRVELSKLIPGFYEMKEAAIMLVLLVAVLVVLDLLFLHCVKEKKLLTK